MSGFNTKWISNWTKNRKDYKPLIKTLEYFKSIKVNGNFNGAIEVKKDELASFLPHFYMITRCDGGFFYYYFTNQNEDILFYLHYSGELKIITLNKKYDEKFRTVIKKTQFIDCLRDNTDRI